jgi:8-oxo-dGTP pyrophosphatase MutT (NUDIX family)
MIEVATGKVYDYLEDRFIGSIVSEEIAVGGGDCDSVPWCNYKIATDRICNCTLTVIWDNKVLLGIRGVPGRFYGHVFSQGGSIDEGESALDAAIREAKEEAGLELSPR